MSNIPDTYSEAINIAQRIVENNQPAPNMNNWPSALRDAAGAYISNSN
jgi:hypothetical protein